MVKADTFWGPLMKSAGDQTIFNVLRVHRHLVGDILQYWQHSLLSLIHISSQMAESIYKRKGFTDTLEGSEC